MIHEIIYVQDNVVFVNDHELTVIDMCNNSTVNNFGWIIFC